VSTDVGELHRPQGGALKKAPTIRDVAAAAGVSVSVVSRVLNPESGPVAPFKREQVLNVINELGYRPRAAARELSAGHALTVGLVVTDLANPFFAQLADRVVWEARSHGVQVVVMTTQEDPHLEAESLDTLLDRSVGGVIATPTGGNVEKWERLRDLGVNVVFVDRAIPDLRRRRRCQHRKLRLGPARNRPPHRPGPRADRPHNRSRKHLHRAFADRRLPGRARKRLRSPRSHAYQGCSLPR
jgi:hypothetical protein